MLLLLNVSVACFVPRVFVFVYMRLTGNGGWGQRLPQFHAANLLAQDR